MRNTNTPKQNLSELEQEIMNILWKKKKATSREIKEALEPEKSLALTTVLTMITRLKKKNYIKEVPSLGRAMMFTYCVPKKNVAEKRIRGLLKQFFSGSPSSLVAHLLDHEGISSEELTEIRRLIQNKTNNKRRL